MTGDSLPSIIQLEAIFRRELTTNARAAAETAYALAFRYRNEDIGGCRRFDLAGEWARCSLKILEDLPSDTLEQIASTQSSIGGVAIPHLLHPGVVQARLADVLHDNSTSPAVTGHAAHAP
ncbi:hypothetical protein H0B56_20355 [Haloechinothrix sp. YIM 98757]|uniref:Uncharacterized protein n=1 Tax=Haloechinothrix aidingensis TaxID=2752311 RepID=A0A838AFH5_9PSEU|nr:hypothetical protein [Haloechinothrix aidingensis]MBA0127905.1 hypothetical protein [Haloechinothrix aidingensis]